MFLPYPKYFYGSLLPSRKSCCSKISRSLSLFGLPEQSNLDQGLKHQKYIVPQFWRVDVWDKGVSRLGSFWRLWGKDLFQVFPLACRRPSSSCVSWHFLLSLHTLCPNFPLFIRTWQYWIRVPPYTSIISPQLITSAIILVPVRAHSEVLTEYQHMNFCGTQFNPSPSTHWSLKHSCVFLTWKIHSKSPKVLSQFSINSQFKISSTYHLNQVWMRLRYHSSWAKIPLICELVKPSNKLSAFKMDVMVMFMCWLDWVKVGPESWVCLWGICGGRLHLNQ